MKEREVFRGKELSEEEKSIARMGRALQRSVNVYTEINMDTMCYRQFNLKDSEGYTVAASGDYAPAYEHMCTEEIQPEDVAQVRDTMAPEVLRSYAADPNGPEEVVARYRLKHVADGKRIMESRAIFMRDETPHYVVSIARDVTEEIEAKRELQEKYEVEKRRSQDDNSILAYAVFNLRTRNTMEMERRAPLKAMDKTMSLDDFRRDILPNIVTQEKKEQFARMFDAEQLLKAHQNGDNEQSMEYQRILPNGKVIWVRSSFHIITDLSETDILLFIIVMILIWVRAWS